MRADSTVVADPANGIAVVAGTAIAMARPDPQGAVRFGGASGALLRPMTFAERTNVVSAAAAAASPRDATAAAILTVATVERGEGDRAMLEVLAMWLAGADWDAPSFAETTLLVARAAGWSPAQLFAAPAMEV